MLRMSEVNEVDHQSMLLLLTEGAVDWDGFGKQIAQETNALLGSPESVLLFDESGFGKKGKSPAGVARQWNGRLGKLRMGTDKHSIINILRRIFCHIQGT